MSEYKTGTRVRLGNCPRHTYREREILAGATGTVVEDEWPSETYVSIALDKPTGLPAGDTQYFMTDEFEVI